MSEATPASLYLPPAIAERMITHARAGAPNEVCGLLRGRRGVVMGWHPAANVAADPRHDYEVAPTDLLAALRWEEAGQALVAIYHSHPADPPYPSASDAWLASYPAAVYIICSLRTPGAPELRGYYLRVLPPAGDLAATGKGQALAEARPGLWARHLTRAQALESGLLPVCPPAVSALYLLHRPAAAPPHRWRLVGIEPVSLHTTHT